MKSILSITLLAFCCLATFAQKPDEKAAAATKTYKDYVSRIKAGDATVNFGAVRKAYVEWVVTNRSAADAPKRDEMVSAFETKNYAKAAELGEAVMEYEIVNAGLARAVSNAFQQVKNEAKSKFYSELARNAEHGLFLSGDGKTEGSAYYVLNISEEYKVMRGLGYTVSMQSLASKDGHSFDILDGKDDAGRSVTMYFNIDSFFP